MKNHFILILCLLAVSCSTKKPDAVKADSSIKIELNTIYEDESRGFMIFYPMTEMDDSLRKKITLPDLTGISDTSYAEIFFTGKNHGGMESSVLVLVTNHISDSPLIWVDYNNNLNFSDAEKPLRFLKDFIDISIADIKDPLLIHTIRLHKPDSIKKPEIKAAIEQFILKGKKYTDFYMDERRNIRVGDFVYKQDSLRIGLVDYNVNGSYNDLGTDRLVSGKYGNKISGTDEASGAIVLDSTTYFQGSTYAFEIVKIANNGTSIIIKPTLTGNIKERIKKGDSIADFAFELVQGKKTSIYDHLDKKKYLYLNFWATWCSGCRQEIDDLKKIHSTFSDKITIVSLNYNENKEKIKSFLAKYKITWLNGVSTQEINKELFIDDLPRNMLIDPSGRMVEIDIHPSELLKRIDQL